MLAAGTASSKGGSVTSDDIRRERGLARLADLDDEPGGDEFLARMGILGDWIVDFAFGDAGSAGFRGFDGSDRAWDAVAAADGERHGLDEVQLLAPCEPQKIVAVGLNYQSHVDETSLARPDVPFAFAIWPSALIGHEEE